MYNFGPVSRIQSTVRIQTREEFSGFVSDMVQDIQYNKGKWENNTLELFLEGILTWIHDLEAYYQNAGEDIPADINWSVLAAMLESAKGD